MSVYKEATIARYICDAADTKPTGVPIGSILFTRDTKQWWKCYDGTNWSVFASSSGNGSVIFEKAITSAANAGSVTIATVTSQPCLIKSATIFAVTAAQTDLTSCAITGGTSNIVTFLSADETIQANLNSVSEQVSWIGNVRLKATETININLVGVGATQVNLLIAIEYQPSADGGYLS